MATLLMASLPSSERDEIPSQLGTLVFDVILRTPFYFFFANVEERTQSETEIDCLPILTIHSWRDVIWQKAKPLFMQLHFRQGRFRC